jgi:hypothetical protein
MPRSKLTEKQKIGAKNLIAEKAHALKSLISEAFHPTAERT